MAPLASAYIRLRTDSSALAGDVRRDATRAGTVGGTVMGREFGTAFRRVSRTLIGLGIGTFAVEAGRFAIDMADKFELSRSRLETVTKNLGGNFNAISSQVQALDNRLAAFGFTNADVEGSVASLESATKSSTKALQDAALAADIARGRNISLESATQILMRVETGHVAMLSRLGIATKDANGNLLTQQEALKQLAQLYGGSASHFAGTFAGKQQALRAELGNTAAEIGVALLPAAVDLAHVLQHDVLPPLQHSAEFFDRNRKTIEPLVGLVIKLTIAYKALKLAQKALGALSVGKAAAGMAGGSLAGEAFSVAHPLPVWVVNQGGKGFPGATPAVEAGDAAGVGYFGRLLGSRAAVGAGMAGAFAVLAYQIAKAARHAPGVQKTTGTIGSVGHVFSSIGHSVLGGGGAGFLGDSFNQIGSFLGVVGKVTHASHAYAASTREDSTAQKTLILTTADLTGKLKDQAKALANAQKKALDLAGGQDQLRQAIHNMAVVAVGQSSGALKGNSDAALANRDALRGAVSAAEAYLGVLKQHHATAKRVADVEYGLATAIKKNADQTYGNRDAVHALLKQLGFLPSQIAPIVTAWNDVASAAMSANAAEYAAANAPGTPGNPLSVGAAEYAANNAAAAANKQAQKQAGGNAAKAFSDGYSKVLDPGLTKALNKATSKAQADAAKITGYFIQTKQSMLSAFATLSTETMTDSLGGSYNRPQSVISQLKQDAAKMHQFAHLWHRLDDMGLDSRLLAQFAGPDYIPAMQELLRGGRKEIRRADRLERRIARDASGIAQTATQDKYGRLIHEDMVGLPPKVEKGFERALRRAGVTVIQLDRHNGHRVAAGG